jgi:hypothetical protein
MRHHRYVRALIALVGSVVMTLVFASPLSAATSTPVAKARAAYLSAVVPYNFVLGAFNATAQKWGDHTTSAQAEMDAKPAIATLRKVDTLLAKYKWPSNVKVDIQTLIGHNRVLIFDLSRLATVDTSTWVAALTRDSASVASSSAVVRNDLGLIPEVPFVNYI